MYLGVLKTRLYETFKELSGITYCWILGIVALAFMARQLLRILKLLIGLDGASILGWGCFLIFGAVVLYYLVNNRTQLWVYTVEAILLLSVIGYAVTLDIFEERIHLVEYAVLGILLSRDLRPRTVREWLQVLLLGIVVGTIDELIQACLPYRVGDPRDVCFDAVGVAWGVCSYMLFRFASVTALSYR